MSFRTFDFECPECGYQEEHSFDLRGMSEEEKDATIASGIRCPNCDHEKMNRVWIKAPGMKMGKDSDMHNINRMKQSFKERFVKKELDDVRNKFGRLYDDSTRSAAAQKIESNVKDD